ncbi:MAG: TetR/AcrR family transcriptional regulator [OCS116 cluster bacterium]|nr:TetR/AcrR family transcriptional regulator [OCS116 cluster bacterium]
MNKISTRAQIIQHADQLFYQQGFENTSFADIAGMVKISRGNFYHHFKSKDEILKAVIELRLANTQNMLDKWQTSTDNPTKRIECFIKILITNWSKIKYYGCPVGTLTSELAKLNHSLQANANELFSLFRNWLAAQFELMGQVKKADAFAMHILARSQGVATLGNSFRDENFVKQEVEQMCDWLNSLKKQQG